MTDQQYDTETHTAMRPRKLNLALSALLDELAETVAARYPMGAANSAEHLMHYDALRLAFNAMETLLTVQPDDIEHRTVVLGYVQRAWELTDGLPVNDVAVTRALKRAREDYLPAVPEQRKRQAADEDETQPEPTHARKARAKS